MGLQDLSQVKEAVVAGHLGGGQLVAVAKGDSLSSSWAVQQGTGELLQTMG